MNRFKVINGRYELPDERCRACGTYGKFNCRPGQFPQCWQCYSKLLYVGRVPDAPCVSPNGRIDGHKEYVREVAGETVCWACGKK